MNATDNQICDMSVHLLRYDSNVNCLPADNSDETFNLFFCFLEAATKFDISTANTWWHFNYLYAG